MKRTLINTITQPSDSLVSVAGWVNARRDHGGLIFIDVRDHTGILQLVIQPELADMFALAESVRDEYVIHVTGSIKQRNEGLENPNIASGHLEMVVSDIKILNKSETLPIPIQEDGPQANEELRLKYRYLDLRRSKMQNMLKKRAEYYSFIRKYMESEEFIEVATPVLANSSPEGARDFLVPSRVHPGKFYALPQAPQQFKQLLMVGGVSRYYQIATCFRDEDPRADRLYGDFYQLDLEMSFVDDGDEVRKTVEPLIIDLVASFAQKKITNLTDGKVVRLTYQEAMNSYGSDKPDLRYDMKLVDISEHLRETSFGVFKNTLENGGVVKAICVKGGSKLSRKQIDELTDIAKQEGAGGLAYIKYENSDVVSPIAKFLSADELAAIKSQLSAEDGDTVFFGVDTLATANKVLGRLRIELADLFNLKDVNEVALAWIVDFPFYERDEKTGKLDFGHNPFSMPKGGLESIRSEDKEAVIADQYDMVMNGYEICSGAVRNYAPDVMYEAFSIVGYDQTHVNKKFGAMINAFKYGAPPHAGCAFGLDRMFMVLTGEENIREVVAFPKNGSGVDVMMSSPSDVDPVQLKELSL